MLLHDPEVEEYDIIEENDVNKRNDEGCNIPNYILRREKIPFKEYVNCDPGIVTSELIIINELIEDKSSDANLINDEEECEVVSPSFKDEWTPLKNIK